MDEKKKIIISIHHDDILFLVAFFSTVFFCGGGQIKLEKIGSLFKKSHIDRALPILYRPLRRICDYLIASS